MISAFHIAEASNDAGNAHAICGEVGKSETIRRQVGKKPTLHRRSVGEMFVYACFGEGWSAGFRRSSARDRGAFVLPARYIDDAAAPFFGFMRGRSAAKHRGMAMTTTDRQAHWENIFTTKGEADVSWFEETPAQSLELLELVGAQPLSAIIDIGGGASHLVDNLLARGFKNVTVLDLSAAALNSVRARLGDKGDAVKWIVADATEWNPPETYDIWHDRAAFHFLTGEKEQQSYILRLKQALRPGGHAIIGTFALDGPEKCSGLPVSRHSAESLSVLLGADFALVNSRRHEHATPWRAVQKFQFSTFRRVA